MTQFNKLLNNQKVLKAFEIPNETIEQMRIIANSLKLGARMKQFYSNASASQRLLLGKIGFVIGNFIDSVKNLVARQAYANDELAKLVTEAKNIERVSYDVLKQNETKRLKRGAGLGELSAIANSVEGE